MKLVLVLFLAMIGCGAMQTDHVLDMWDFGFWFLAWGLVLVLLIEKR